MSYILEALKKLEEKRHRTETPHDLLMPREAASLHVERRPFRHYILIVVLMLNAGLLLWWLRPWQPPGAHGSGDHTESTVSAVRPVPSALLRPKGGSETGGGMATPSVPPYEGGDLNVIPDSPARSATTALQTDLNAARNKIRSREDRKVYTFNDLPPSVRQDMPVVTIAGHFYSSDPSSRIIVVNGKIVHEGQVVAGNLRIEQITPDGVIMSFEGYRFRRGVF